MASLQLNELSVGQPTASGEMMDLLMERNAEMVGQPELVPNLLDQLDSEFAHSSPSYFKIHQECFRNLETVAGRGNADHEPDGSIESH